MEKAEITDSSCRMTSPFQFEAGPHTSMLFAAFRGCNVVTILLLRCGRGEETIIVRKTSPELAIIVGVVIIPGLPANCTYPFC